MKYILVLVVSLSLVACKENTKSSNVEDLTANEIVDKSIEVSGGSKFDKSIISFDFRDMFYSAKRNNGKFQLKRKFTKDNDTIVDILSNNGFERLVNENITAVEDSMVPRYSASVNSVHYFSVLPYGLNDKAVNKSLLGDETIKHKRYYKIKVTFSEDGGGEDFDDVFVYWVNQKTFKVDYLAYSYKEDSGIGMRFREAYNERFIDDLRFVDYNNFKSEDKLIQLEYLAKAFEQDQLELLSKIELENVKVDILK